jgi:class 3 adenylate cyclase
VTFLFTDIEDSSAQWERAPERMRRSLAIHDSIIASEVKRAPGRLLKHLGDGVIAVFASADAAIGAALGTQGRLLEEAWTESMPLTVRMGLHEGAPFGGPAPMGEPVAGCWWSSAGRTRSG